MSKPDTIEAIREDREDTEKQLQEHCTALDLMKNLVDSSRESRDKGTITEFLSIASYPLHHTIKNNKKIS